MDEPSTERTPQSIAAEINSIKQQTCKIIHYQCHGDRKRLKEAKDLLSHGEWGKMAGGIGELFSAHSQQADAVL